MAHCDGVDPCAPRAEVGRVPGVVHGALENLLVLAQQVAPCLETRLHDAATNVEDGAIALDVGVLDLLA